MLQELQGIPWGQVMQTAVWAVAAIAFVLTIKSDVRVIRHDLRHLEEKQTVLNEAFSQLGKILTEVAVQDARIHMMEKYIDELRHGQGFVTSK